MALYKNIRINKKLFEEKNLDLFLLYVYIEKKCFINFFFFNSLYIGYLDMCDQHLNNLRRTPEEDAGG